MNNANESPDREPNLPALAPSAELDAHGFSPADYKWVPVLRRPRADGWTPQRQVDFIALLADIGCVEQAAREVGMSVMSCYRLRRAPGAENFAAAWDAALAQAARKLVDLAFERAINGSEEPVFDKQGNRVGRRMRHNDRLLMFLLRAYLPDRFRHAHHSVRFPDEAPPAVAEAVGEALRRLEPVPPERPHLLMAPDELADELFMADALNGKLPHWRRGRPELSDPLPDPKDTQLERILDEAREAVDWRLPADAEDGGNAFLA